MKTKDRSRIPDLVPIYLALRSFLISPVFQLVCEVRKRTMAGITFEDFGIVSSLVVPSALKWALLIRLTSLNPGTVFVFGIEETSKKTDFWWFMWPNLGAAEDAPAISFPSVLFLWSPLSSWMAPLIDYVVDKKSATRYAIAVSTRLCSVFLQCLPCRSGVYFSTPWIWLMGKQQTWHKQRPEKCFALRLASHCCSSASLKSPCIETCVLVGT